MRPRLTDALPRVGIDPGRLQMQELAHLWPVLTFALLLATVIEFMR